MERRVQIAMGFGVAVLAVGIAWVAVPQPSVPETGTQPLPVSSTEQPLQPPEAPVPAPSQRQEPPRSEESTLPVLPPDAAVASPRENVVIRPAEPMEPLNDGEAWRQLRLGMAAKWESTTLHFAREHAQTEGLDEGTTSRMIATLERLHRQLRSTRADIESGTIRPAQGRTQMDQAKSEAETELVDVLGQEGMEALRAELDQVKGGGF